jgi:hypothetical protein
MMVGESEMPTHQKDF